MSFYTRKKMKLHYTTDPVASNIQAKSTFPFFYCLMWDNNGLIWANDPMFDAYDVHLTLGQTPRTKWDAHPNHPS